MEPRPNPEVSSSSHVPNVTSPTSALREEQQREEGRGDAPMDELIRTLREMRMTLHDVVAIQDEQRDQISSDDIRGVGQTRASRLRHTPVFGNKARGGAL